MQEEASTILGAQQDPDSLLDIVLRMDSAGKQAGSPPHQRGLDGAAPVDRDSPPISYAAGPGSGGGGRAPPPGGPKSSAVPLLADLGGLLDIDDLPGVPAALGPAELTSRDELWAQPEIYLSDPGSLQQVSYYYDDDYYDHHHEPSPPNSVPQASSEPPTEPNQPRCQSAPNPNDSVPAFGVTPAGVYRLGSTVQSAAHQINQHLHHQQQQQQPSQQAAKQTRPRRRVTTPSQRKAANVRERRRMFNLNEAFDSLRKTVPTFAHERRMSRIETLRLAMLYIAFMADVLDGAGGEMRHGGGAAGSPGQVTRLLESGKFDGLAGAGRSPRAAAAAAGGSREAVAGRTRRRSGRTPAAPAPDESENGHE